MINKTDEIKVQQWVATCERGFESLLKTELLSFGAGDIDIKMQALSFSGSLEVVLRTCLWSRVALRVLKPILSFDAKDTDLLYDGARSINWQEHFSLDSTFAIDVACKRAVITNSHFASLRVKDGVVDYFLDVHGERPSVAVKEPDVKIFLFLDGDEATLSIDLSGDSLHRRAYRSGTGEAPIKEHLAAGMLMLTGWTPAAFNYDTEHVSPEEGVCPQIFIDPMCGSGTLLIEAALIATDTAPGIFRHYYGFYGWKGFQPQIWADLRDEALKRSYQGKAQVNVKIIGYDASREAVAITKNNLASAQFETLVHVERRELAQLKAPALTQSGADLLPQGAYIASNPPYGNRLGELKPTRYLYRFLGQRLSEQFVGWRAAIISDQAELLDMMRINDFDSYKVLHGGSPAVLRTWRVKKDEKAIVLPCSSSITELNDTLSEAVSVDLANRLRKNFKRLKKDFHGSFPYCYRLYDADLPEYNVAIDVYGDSLHVQEYAPPSSIDQEKAKTRFKVAVRTVGELLNVKYEKRFLKLRRQQKGSTQYARQARKGKLIEVYEDRCRLLVNLTDYLDAGLFLDHRNVRKMIQERAEGKHFLNLFCYTGSASIHAAIGGAKSTTSVDLSLNYLEWAACNFNLNGFSETNHHLIRADALSWLENCSNQYELIFVDPPTFSNSKKMQSHFDVQTSHVDLITEAMRHLAPEGELIFSNNFKRFKLDEAALDQFDFEEITAATTGADFSRRGNLHRCWRITHR